jgi:hypothetical protein
VGRKYKIVAVHNDQNVVVLDLPSYHTFMESANIARPLINARSSTVIATLGPDIDERLIVVGSQYLKKRIVPVEALLQ